MPTLLYYWDFTGNNANTNEVLASPNIYDKQSSLKAVVRQRGTVTNKSSVSRSLDGIFLDNDDGENGGYYIDLEGLNTIQFGGNLTIEMAVQNHKRKNHKAIYFLSVGEDNGTNQAFINARYNGNKDKMFFGVRTDQYDPAAAPPYDDGVKYIERKVSEDSTVIDDDDEHHYIFSFNYDSSGSSVKLYIDGSKKGEITGTSNDLQKALTTTARSTNFIGTRKVEGAGVTYLKGVVKYLKIYQNAITDNNEATNIYNNYNSSAINFSDISGESNANIYTRRHTEIDLHFSNFPDISSLALLGKQLGLTDSTATYVVHKFVNQNTIEITSNNNYVNLNTKDNYVIFNYDGLYFKITQTSLANGITSTYKGELSTGDPNDSNSFTPLFENKTYGDVVTYNNVTIILGGVEFNFTDTNPICFHENTIIETDQGKIKIKNLTNNYTIKNCKIVSVIKSPEKPKHLVLIKRNAFGKNLPKTNIKITPTHEIYLYNRYVPVYKLINNKTVFLIYNDNSFVYNIIMVNKATINISNLYLGVIYITENTYRKLDHYKKKGLANYTFTGYPLRINKPSKLDRKINIDLTQI